LQHQLAASGETALSLTDPDSRSMMSRGRIEVCYNVQTAVDAKHKLIVAEDVTNAAADRDQLSPMASAAQDILGDATPLRHLRHRLLLGCHRHHSSAPGPSRCTPNRCPGKPGAV
jgi:hypothetical protein